MVMAIKKTRIWRATTLSENQLYGRFIWREPGTKRPYDIEEVANLAFVPRVGEEVEIQASSDSVRPFEFHGTFVVEKVSYRMMTGPTTSQDPADSWQTVAYEQVALIYVQPLDKSGWSIVQRIKKGH